jgi:hypothetical protein
LSFKSRIFTDLSVRVFDCRVILFNENSLHKLYSLGWKIQEYSSLFTVFLSRQTTTFERIRKVKICYNLQHCELDKPRGVVLRWVRLAKTRQIQANRTGKLHVFSYQSTLSYTTTSKNHQFIFSHLKTTRN